MSPVVPAVTRQGLTARERTGLIFHAVAALVLVPAYLLVAPPSRWDQPLLLAVLSILAVVAVRHDVPLPAGIQFDATAALALIAVALAGPLPALAVIFPPIAVNALSGRERLLRAGNLQLLVNWAVGPAVYGTLWLGHPLRALVEMLRDALPAGTVMAALGALTVVLSGSIGLLALALFAVVAVLPQSALTYIARTRPVARLDPLTAARRYGNAMAVHLGLNRAERRELDAVIRLAYAREVTGDPAEHLGHAVSDWSEVSCAAGHVTEWWNGAGGPAGLPGAIIPRSARIAAVARTWAALTAEGSPRLGHADALAHLQCAAGVRLDPAVVRAAHAVVCQERLSPAEPAPEPRLHHLHVPARLRRVLAASV